MVYKEIIKEALTMASLTKVEGIGKKFQKELQKAGISTTDALLKNGATRKGRNQIAKDSGISAKLILEWVNHADLFRIKGVGEEYADLLEASGVDTVVELGKRVPENLHAKMAEVNSKGKRKLVRQLPGINQVKAWIKQAKRLKRVVTH
jgi:predicted flap endonuclease-1-like 5' DNA nuclease